MPQRDNGSFPDDLSSLVPAKDELREFPASTRLTPKTPDPVKPPANVPPQAVPKSLWLVLMALVTVVLALAGFAAYSWQLSQMANQQLTQASERIASLEARLSSTDASVTESSGSLAVRINELKAQQDKLVSDVDKLWASAWRENQKSIAAHGDALKAADKRVTELEKQVKENLSLVKQAAGDITLVKAQIDAAEEAAKSMIEVRQSVTAQSSQIEKMNTRLSGDHDNLQKLSRRVQETEDWAASFNEFRRQVNLQLEMMRDGGKK